LIQLQDLPAEQHIMDTLHALLTGRLPEGNDLVLITDSGFISGSPVTAKDSEGKSHRCKTMPFPLKEAYDIHGKTHYPSSSVFSRNGYILLGNAKMTKLSDNVLEADYLIVFFDQIKNISVGKFY
jgi:hypothetical protein